MFLGDLHSPSPHADCTAASCVRLPLRFRAILRACTIATAVDRRENIVVASSVLTHSDRQALRSGLRSIRFVSLQQVTRPPLPENDVVIADATWPTERILEEFGL